MPSRPDDATPEKGFDAPARLSYGTYLKVPELLGLQQLLSSHHDELQFIVVHQTYELWFRLMIHELEAARAHLLAGNGDDAELALHRIHEIEKVLIQQVHVLETMTPAAFLGFRDLLRPASGFQSVQFREVEVLSGLRDRAYLDLLAAENVEEVNRTVQLRLAEPSLRDAMHGYLQGRGLDVGSSSDAGTHDEARLDAVLLQVYRTLEPRSVYRVLEALVDHDELFGLWRQHHVAMVERLIGTKRGTGGSSGAAYLRATTSYRFFPELWRVRGALGDQPY